MMIAPGSTPLSFDRVAPRVRAIKTLREWIDQGVLERGAPLPPERELSKKLNVGLATIQRALKVLEVEGLIRKHAGRTRIVSEGGPAGRLIRNAVAVLGMPPRPGHMHHTPGWMDFISYGAFDAISAAGLHGLSFNPYRLSADELNSLLLDKPCGILIPEIYLQPIPPKELLEILQKTEVPVAAYGDAPELAGFDRVLSDHDDGAYQVTRWLISKGYKRILQILPANTLYWAEARKSGYERAMKEAGLPALPIVRTQHATSDSPGRQEALRAQARYLAECMMPSFTGPETPDAVMAVSDGEFFATAAALRILNREPNKDVGVTGYDHFWQDSNLKEFETTRPLVTVDKFNFELGQQMGKLLMERAKGKLPPGPQRLSLKPELIVVD